MNAYPQYLSSFGRNRGRSLSAYQQRLVENFLPQLRIPSPHRGEDGRGALCGEASPPNAPSPHNDPANRLRLPLRGRGRDTAVPATNTHTSNDEYKQFTLEIGFGAGEHLAAQARHHPERHYLGSEPYINGVAKLLAVIDREKLTNIRIDTRDVRALLSELPDASLAEIFILFPDPWPKTRHHKRRLINAATLAMLARVHQPGGRLLIATDHLDYADWILEQLLHQEYYRLDRARDRHKPPAEWTETKYQRKTTAQGRLPVFFECERNTI